MKAQAFLFINTHWRNWVTNLHTRRVQKLAMVALVAGLSSSLFAANHYISAGAMGSNNGASWANAWTNLASVTWTRGDTYYVASGNYGSYTFKAAINGAMVITIKKAIVADHGSDIGWDNSMAAQAVFTVPVNFSTAYWTFDGNGPNSLPSNNTNDYGFTVVNDSLTANTMVIKANDVTIRYVHIYSVYKGSDNSDSVAVGYFPNIQRVKLQNCWIENCGRDGLQMNSASYLLVEKCYLQKMGTRHAFVPDRHGQTVQMFSGASHVVFRWNIWDRCEGQAMIAYANTGYTTTDLRFYGNVVFNGYGTTDSGGFNGGIISNNDLANTVSNIFIYNNTIVNERDSYCVYSTLTEFKIHSGTTNVGNCFLYNNLFYNCNTSIAPRYTATAYHASGGYGTAGGTNEQTGITDSIFTNYAGNDFRLASSTWPGQVLANEPWWNSSFDSFFGQLDYAIDMFGAMRGSDGAWDRGAIEFNAALRPTAPRNLKTVPTIP